MTKIKICGLSREEDIVAVNQQKPDYIGFVFAPSRRLVTPNQAAVLREKLENGIKAVGVFVNEEATVIRKTAEMCGLDVVQLHGDEKNEDIRRISDGGFEIWKALRVGNQRHLDQLGQYEVSRYLLDAYVEGEYGGSGKRIDLPLLKTIPKTLMRKKIVIAGGLTSENVAEIAAEVEPYGVDVSSGVEIEGKKDAAKMAAFCRNVREEQH